ncbi:MAG: hypothetical protein QNJ42_24280 [Crocosphaera sp.]|nr:hypothetical protein [Crocosphaera sp.]
MGLFNPLVVYLVNFDLDTLTLGDVDNDIGIVQGGAASGVTYRTHLGSFLTNINILSKLPSNLLSNFKLE